MKVNDRRILGKKRKKKKTKKKTKTKSSKIRKRIRKLKTNKSVKILPQNDIELAKLEERQPLGLSKDVAKLKTLHMFETWIQRDELDVVKPIDNLH